MVNLNFLGGGGGISFLTETKVSLTLAKSRIIKAISS